MYHLLLIGDSESPETARLRGSGFQLSVRRTLPPDFSQFDLILLNASPDGCVANVRNIRAHSDLPLIALSEVTGLAECVVALESGADDFIRKPVDELELAARIKSLLRRSRAGENQHKSIVVGDLELYPGSRLVKRLGVPIHLTGIEFDLLLLLVQSTETLVTRELIASKVFQRRRHMSNRSIDVHMSSLRKKLGPQNGSNSAERIRTIRGHGYVYMDD